MKRPKKLEFNCSWNEIEKYIKEECKFPRNVNWKDLPISFNTNKISLGLPFLSAYESLDKNFINIDIGDE
jgi:ribosome biogenesis protein Tsr3